MNPIARSRARAIVRAKGNIKNSLEAGYDSLKLSFPHFPQYRSKERYEELLSVCSECCPGGFCLECGCMYGVKLLSSDFTCQIGKFGHD